MQGTDISKWDCWDSDISGRAELIHQMRLDATAQRNGQPYNRPGIKRRVACAADIMEALDARLDVTMTSLYRQLNVVRNRKRKAAAQGAHSAYNVLHGEEQGLKTALRLVKFLLESPITQPVDREEERGHKHRDSPPRERKEAPTTGPHKPTCINARCRGCAVL